MLDVALRARIPIVFGHTRDLGMIPDLLRDLSGLPASEWGTGDLVPATATSVKVVPNRVYWWVQRGAAKVGRIEIAYQTLADVGSVLVVLNGPEIPCGMMDVGEILPSRALMGRALSGVCKKPETILPALTGLTVRDALEIIRIIQSRKEKVSFESVAATRQSFFPPARGLVPVRTDDEFYVVTPELHEWVAQESRFFHGDYPKILRPRGLLFTGPPGTGKTVGAKIVARTLKVPMYRLDLSTVKDRWVGASEANFRGVLAEMDLLAPCVVLIDEVEKIFRSNEDSGVSNSILSMLLWWLAEHPHRILTVMTSNHPERLPPELYREGRVNRTIGFGPLAPARARVVMGQFFDTLGLPGLREKTKDLIGSQSLTVADTLGIAIRAVKAHLTQEGE